MFSWRWMRLLPLKNGGWRAVGVPIELSQSRLGVGVLVVITCTKSVSCNGVAGGRAGR